MSFFDEYNKTTTTKKGTPTDVKTPVTPAVAPTGSFFDEFTTKKDTAIPTTPLTPPKVENTSTFSSFFSDFKKVGSSFAADAVTTFSGLAGMPRDIAIYGTKGVQSFGQGVSKAMEDPRKITDVGYAPSREFEAKPSTTNDFYQNIVDELGKGKLDQSNWDTKIQTKAKEFGDKLQTEAGVDITNRTFAQNLGGGFGSMVGFFVPSFAAGKTASMLIKSKNAANIYKNVGGTSMVLNESFMEGNQVFQDVYQQTGNVQEAQKKADNTVAANIALIGITNKYSRYFENTAPGFRNLVKGVLTTAISEGPIQEGGQQLISNINTGRPIFEGVTESAIIGSIVGGVTHMATRNLAPDSPVVIPPKKDEDKEKNIFQELKEKIFKENKGNPVVDEYAKNDKILTDTISYIQSTKEVETPEQVKQTLIDNGMDEETAIQMMNESVLQDIRDSTEDVTPEALQADIDAFMGSVPTEEVITIKEKTTPQEDQVSQTTKKVTAEESIDISVIPEEKQKEAETDWQDNYEEDYGMKQDELRTLQAQLKGRKGEAKKTTQARIDTISEQLANLETDFLNKHAPEQVKELEQLQGKVTADTVKSESPTFEPTPFVEARGKEWKVAKQGGVNGISSFRLETKELSEKGETATFTLGEDALEVTIDKNPIDGFVNIEEIQKGIAPIDIADEQVDNKDNEQRNQSNQISNPSDVSTGADLGRSSETTSEVSGYDRAAMLTQSGFGFGNDRTSKLTKSQRQLINQEVEGLLEAKEYSQNPDDYTETDKDLMRAYSGAGGKESVGGEGQGLLNEYYTPREVIGRLWTIAERLSPNMETAFEPSAGTGRIISLAPASVKVDGAEISKVSGTIAQVLNPDSTITIGDFQELFFDKKTNKAKIPQQYDVVIGNPPFGERAGFLKGKGEESDINRQEEYFIKRGLDMTKDGGYLIYVVNSSFLKTKMSKGKEAIAKLGGLVDAYRLPENTFEDTSIGTDIVIFKKGSIPNSTARHGSISEDTYFNQFPQNKLGAHLLRKNRFGQTESYIKGNLEDSLKLLDTILPEAANRSEAIEEVPATEEKSPKVTKTKQVSTKKIQKEVKKVAKDTQATLPKDNASELITPAQDISNRKTTNPVEIQMLKRILRDMSIPTPSSEEMKYLNVGKDNKMYPDAIYFSGEVIEKLDDLKKNKKIIVENYGEAQYEKQLKGLENAVPATFPLKDIIFDPIDRHIGQIKVGQMKKFGHYGQEVEGTLLMLFTNYLRNNDVAMSPRVTKYDITRYVNGEQAAKDTKPIMGSIKSDAKRLFNHFIKHELDATIQKGIEEKYNREKNGYVNPDYSQIPVEVQDMTKQFRGDDFKMSQTQKNGVGFLVNKGSGLIAYGVGVGKDQPLTSKILTPNGWKTMGDMKVGQLVISQKGTPTKIKNIYPQGEKSVYKVYFSDDTIVECGEEHLWKVQTIHDRNDNGGKKWRVLETKEIAKYIRNKRGNLYYSIPQTQPVEFKEKNTELDPYITGFLIGDGSLSKKSIRFSTSDIEIVSKVKECLPKELSVKYCSKYDYAINGGVQKYIKSMGLFGHKSESKFIPDNYKYNSVENRVKLLQGLMDSDGYASKNGRVAQFSTVSEQLKNDFVELVQSLGGICYVSSRIPTYTYKGDKKQGQLAYTVTISLPNEIAPFWLPRKVARFIPKTKYQPIRFITKVEFDRFDLTQCIEVEDESHTYITDNYAVTHNTHTLAIATKANMDKGWTKRPLFTVPKTTISKTWIGTLHEMFPTLKINNLEGLQAPVIARLKRERGEDPKNWIQDGEFTVISHEGLLRLGFKEDELRDAAGDLQDAIWKDESTKRAKEGQKNKFDEILGNAQKYVTDVMLSDLGFDHVSVDEVHNFRKIFQGAKPENVDKDGNAVGRKRYGNVVGGTPSKRAQQLFLISQYIQKKNNNRNVFLASATPFENHATEVYNILSLVARDRMKQMGILNINDFFSVFANFEVELDYDLKGNPITKEKMKEFANVQALQALIKEFIDFQIDPTLVRPERRVITPHLQMSFKQEENLVKIQNLLAGVKEIIDDSQAFAEDSKTMYDVSSEGAEDGAFLKASGYSVTNSISPWFIEEYAGVTTDMKQLVEDSPKIKYTLEALKTLKEDPKTKDFGTFIFFGKMGVDYHPMIAEYFAKELGYERNQVAHLSGSVTDEQKEDIKERFNKGEIKVLIGGDQTKEGIDLQNNGFMTFNLALGWNPTQIAQVEGRVWRQGNRRSIAPLVYPLVENSGDAIIYSKFEEKGGRINDLFSYAGTVFDIGEINPAEKKLALVTSPEMKAKMQIEIDKTVLYNERVMIDNDMKALQKLRGDLNQSKEDITYYKKEIEDLKDMSYMPEERKVEKAKEYKKEIKNAEGRVERIEAKLKEKNITDINATIGEMEGQMLDIDNKIKEIDKTYEPLLAKFTEEYRENIKKRKTIEQHMDEIKGLISELKERTPEEIKQLRNQKIAELEKIKGSIPEFQRVEDTAEDVAERAKLREDANILMLDMQNNVGTEEERSKRYFDLMKRWEMLGRPEFQRTNTTKEPIISFEEGKKRIEAYKKRLNLNFDVDFVHTIITPERGRAYGVTYNNKISLIDNIKLTTADHEIVHMVVDHIEEIDAFKGITKEQLLLAQNKGKAYTEADYERLNEELAIGFQKKVLGEEQSNVPMVIRRFYDKLQILLTDMFRALGMEINVISDFYRKLATSQGGTPVTFKSDIRLDQRVQFERNGKRSVDFYPEIMKEMDDIRRAGFERIVEIAKDYSIDLKRKDINYIENLFAISRDIYLKDPVEFKQADEFMKIGDSRRMKKEILDVKFSEMLAPYYDLSKSEQTDVNTVLMQGDRDTKEYTEEELLKSNLTPAQIRAYVAVRRSFNTAHQLLIDEMERTGVKAEEIETFKKERRGYMPHKWKYRFAIKTQTLGEGQDPLQSGNWKTQTMDVYETERKANKVFEQLKKDNKDPEHIRYVNDTLDSLEVDFFSEQRFSFENMKSMIAKAKTGNDVKDEMIGAMRDIIKEKGFGRHFIKRTGIQGYETKEVPEIMANYFAGLNGFITKMEAGKEYYGVLEKIDARRQKNFYTWIRDSIAYDMGNTKEWNMLKKVAFVYSLANDMSFLLTNATQNWVIGVGELTKLYKNNASKVVGAEATLMKATADWAIGNISPEEKTVIEGLLKVGRLGGEMTSELMGFKNNPIYAALDSKLNTILYSTTAFVEQNVNRVPAFLSARRILKSQGLTDKEANEQALKVADDINFRGGKQHRPVFMRGRLGTIFVFNTYIRSFLYQLSRDLKEKEFVSLTKKMFYTTLLGGVSALPFAELIMNLVEKLVPPDPEDEIKDELNTWSYALKKGPVNAFLNVDISSRVNINIFGVSNIIKDPLNVISWAGAVGTLIGKRIPDGVTLYKQDRYLEAFGKLMPDFIGNPLRAYNGAMYGVTTASGNPLIDENGQEFKYTTYEAWVKAFGYSPARESIAWDELSKQWVAKDEQSAKSSIIQGKIKRQIREGDIEGAKETQAEGLASGGITDKSVDYVKKAVTEQTMKSKYEEWNTGTKSRPVLDKMERDIAKEIYGDKYTKTQLTNVTRDFAFYRTFGFDNALANEINKAQSTAEKVELLKKAREEMTLEEFKAFFNKGRTVVKYEATSKGGENTGYVLISDALRKAYFAK